MALVQAVQEAEEGRNSARSTYAASTTDGSVARHAAAEASIGPSSAALIDATTNVSRSRPTQ